MTQTFVNMINSGQLSSWWKRFHSFMVKAELKPM
jgi:hypothetical protein